MDSTHFDIEMENIRCAITDLLFCWQTIQVYEHAEFPKVGWTSTSKLVVTEEEGLQMQLMWTYFDDPTYLVTLEITRPGVLLVKVKNPPRGIDREWEPIQLWDEATNRNDMIDYNYANLNDLCYRVVGAVRQMIMARGDKLEKVKDPSKPE